MISVEAEASIRGFVYGKPARNVHVMGRRDTGWVNTTGFHDVVQYLGSTQQAINIPTADQVLYISSTSTSDTAAGIGARSVRITSLTALGNETSTTVTLNGTTPVPIGSGHSYIQFMETASVGSNNAAVGNISLTTTNAAGTPTNTVESIIATGNKSLSGRYKIPAGHVGYLTTFAALSIGAADMDARIRSQVFTDNRAISSVLHFQESMYLSSGQNMSMQLPYLVHPALSELRIVVKPSATQATNRFDSSFSLLLLDQRS